MITAVEDTVYLAWRAAYDEAAHIAVDLQRLEAVAPGILAAIALLPDDQRRDWLQALHRCRHAAQLDLTEPDGDASWYITWRDGAGTPGRIHIWPMPAA